MAKPIAGESIGGILDALIQTYIPDVVGDPPRFASPWSMPPPAPPSPTTSPKPQSPEPTPVEPLPDPTPVPSIQAEQVARETIETYTPYAPIPEGPLDSNWVKEEMKRLNVSQSWMGPILGITGRAVGEWFEAGRIPDHHKEKVYQILKKAHFINQIV